MTACLWYISKYAALPSTGRVGTRAFLLLRELAASGVRPVMLTSDSNHLTEPPRFAGASFRQVEDGVEVRWIRTRKYVGARSVGRVLSWLDFEWRLWRLPKGDLPRPDAVIVSSLSLLTIFNGLWLRRRHGCRLIFEVRDIWPLTIVEEGGFSPRNPLVMALAWVERLAYRKADAIVGTMPNLVEHVAAVAPGHAPVFCVPMGIDPLLLNGTAPLPDGWADEWIPRDRFIVCHAGTIGITNALDTLLQCARSMKAHDGIHFLIVGDGDLKERHRQECADLPNVTFAPAVPKEQVQSVLARCDLLYFAVHRSNVWRFGLSLNKLIDYMLAAKPVLASYTGHPSMIDEAGAGSFVPAGDAAALKTEILRYAHLPPTEREEMGARGRAWLLRERTYAKLAAELLRISLPDAGQDGTRNASGERPDGEDGRVHGL